jgi:hypothetical protein
MVWGEAASIKAISVLQKSGASSAARPMKACLAGAKKQSAQRSEPLRPDFRHRDCGVVCQLRITAMRAGSRVQQAKKPSCDGFFAFAGSAPVSNGEP